MRRGKLATVVLVFAGALVLGSWLVRRGVASPSQDHRLTASQGAHLLDAVMTRIRESWVDSMSTDEMYRRARIGLIEELGDPHTEFLSADRLRRLREATSGSYQGVGMSIDKREGWIVVISRRVGSPADRAGIQAGDRLLALDGQSMRGWTVDEARNALRGPPGSSVHLMVDRGGDGARIPLTVYRGDIHVSSVQRSMVLDGGVGHVAITTFSDSTALDVTHAVDSLVHAGATSLILDLRGNPGGLLSQGVAVADIFLDRGLKIVSTRGRGAGTTAEYFAQSDQRWPKLPIVVLVNGGTASAAEIVAGALQDHDRAIVMGRPSYGKGSAQAVVQLDDSSALKITNARWFTPSGRSIERPHLSRSAVRVPGDTVRPRYKTDRGRVVIGGGGIVPDVVAGDSAISPAERAWVSAVGAKVPQFRDALTTWVAEVIRSHPLADPEFVVTPEMRDGLWREMVAKGLVVHRSIYDAAREAIDRVLGTEIARERFGVAGAQRRVVRTDPVVERAARLLRGVSAPSALFQRVADAAGKNEKRTPSQ